MSEKAPPKIEAESDALADDVVEMEYEVIGEIQPDDEPGTRTVRVYDPGGDFLIEIPRSAKVTFGYFNPAVGGQGYGDRGFGDGRGSQTGKTTALRIYERGEKSNQLACFLGVTGFRDHEVKLTRLRQRVTIESNFEDDGIGGQEARERRQRELVQAVEDEEIPF